MSPGVAALLGIVVGAGAALAWSPPTIDVELRVGPPPQRNRRPSVLAALPFGHARGLR